MHEGVRRSRQIGMADVVTGVVVGNMLDAVGAPVRALPPSARLVVDFLALSLLLWVPLVWLIALFVMGK